MQREKNTFLFKMIIDLQNSRFYEKEFSGTKRNDDPMTREKKWAAKIPGGLWPKLLGVESLSRRASSFSVLNGSGLWSYASFQCPIRRPFLFSSSSSQCHNLCQVSIFQQSFYLYYYYFFLDRPITSFSNMASYYFSPLS